MLLASYSSNNACYILPCISATPDCNSGTVRPSKPFPASVSLVTVFDYSIEKNNQYTAGTDMLGKTGNRVSGQAGIQQEKWR